MGGGQRAVVPGMWLGAPKPLVDRVPDCAWGEQIPVWKSALSTRAERRSFRCPRAEAPSREVSVVFSAVRGRASVGWQPDLGGCVAIL